MCNYTKHVYLIRVLRRTYALNGQGSDICCYKYPGIPSCWNKTNVLAISESNCAAQHHVYGRREEEWPDEEKCALHNEGAPGGVVEMRPYTGTKATHFA